MTPRRSRRGGFTLLELSIVLTIISLIVAMALPMGWSIRDSMQRVATNKRLDQIEAALMAYRVAYNRLPCPADPSLLPGNSNYGVEITSPGSCNGGTTAVKTNTTSSSAVPKEVVEGAVPVKALGLPNEFLYDGWGREILYAVNNTVTATSAMLHQTLAESCGITVNDASGNARTTGAVYALVSFGSDGQGGYLKDGQRFDAGVSNTDEQTNCHCTTGPLAATAYNSTYVQKDTSLDASDASHPFDDLVRYKMRWQMMSPDDPYNWMGPVCSFGARIDGTVANQHIGGSGNCGGVRTADINGDGIPDLLIPGLDSTSGDCDLYVVFGQQGGITPNPFLLTSLNGSNGTVIKGTQGAGTISVTAGDFNGDGVQDLGILACDANGALSCSAYIVFGQTGTWPSSVSLSAISTTTTPSGIKFSNTPAYATIAPTTGDINGATNGGNAIADLVIGGQTDTENGQTYAGDVYVVFGNATISSIATNLNSLNGTNGVKIEGSQANGELGSGGYLTDRYAGIGFGDLNHDNYTDLIIGAPSRAVSSDYGYIIWGAAPATFTATGGVINLNSLVAGQDLQINRGGGAIDSATDGSFGSSITVGDINGDGIADAVIDDISGTCSWNSNSGCGMVYILYGSSSLSSATTFDLNNLNGTNGTLVGADWHTAGVSNDEYPAWVGLADLNNDGKPDLLVLTNDGSNHSYNFWTAMNEGTAGWPCCASPWNIVNANGTNGFTFGWNTITGGTSLTGFAWGDINGDGITDVAVGNTGANSSAGAVYVVMGNNGTGWATSITPGSNLSTYGYEFDGVTAGDEAGSSVATLDFNNDGVQDLAISAPDASPNGVSGAGSVYVVWGRKKGWPSNPFSLSNIP